MAESITLADIEQGPSMFIGKSGNGIISFGSGQPDIPPPISVFDVLREFHYFQYGDVQGEAALRDAVAKDLIKNFKVPSAAENVVITNGASEALNLILSSNIKIGEKVLLVKPYYYSYLPLVRINHGTPVFCLTANNKIDLEDLKEKVKGAKIMLLNSPANPTGAVEDKKTLKAVQEITQDAGTLLVSDEVYCALVYEGKHYSPTGENVITVNSFSKTFSMCGFRVGFLSCMDSRVVKNVVSQKTYTSMNTSILSQAVALGTMGIPMGFAERNRLMFKERRDLIYERLSGMGLEVEKPEGAFYILPKVENPKQACFDLYTKHKVITYVGDWFGADGHLRFSYSMNLDKINEGMDRLADYLRIRTHQQI